MRFKPLVWIKRDCWIAETPASDLKYISICYEQGKYWASWDLALPGSLNIETIKQAGQDYHNRWLEQFIQPAVEPWEDRMGGQFTQEEIARAERGGEGW